MSRGGARPGAGKPKGHPRPAGSGRAKGTPNKDKQLLRDKAQALGVDPFEIMLLLAKGDWKRLGYPAETWRKESAGNIVNDEYFITPELRGNMASRACKYLYPELKAIEHSGEIDTGIADILRKAKAQADSE